MRRTWKKLATLLLAGAVLVSTTACGGGETSGKQKDMENKVLRVLNWGNTEEEKIANEAIARFNENNPDVEVKQTCVPVTLSLIHI